MKNKFSAFDHHLEFIYNSFFFFCCFIFVCWSYSKKHILNSTRWVSKAITIIFLYNSLVTLIIKTLLLVFPKSKTY